MRYLEDLTTFGRFYMPNGDGGGTAADSGNADAGGAGAGDAGVAADGGAAFDVGSTADFTQASFGSSAAFTSSFDPITAGFQQALATTPDFTSSFFLGSAFDQATINPLDLSTVGLLDSEQFSFAGPDGVEADFSGADPANQPDEGGMSLAERRFEAQEKRYNDQLQRISDNQDRQARNDFYQLLLGIAGFVYAVYADERQRKDAEDRFDKELAFKREERDATFEQQMALARMQGEFNLEAQRIASDNSNRGGGAVTRGQRTEFT
jgi:hypothetical protein